MVEDQKTWAEAEQECKNRKATLVSILDKATQFFLLNHIKLPEAWIGLSNIKV